MPGTASFKELSTIEAIRRHIFSITDWLVGVFGKIKSNWLDFVLISLFW